MRIYVSRSRLQIYIVVYILLISRSFILRVPGHLVQMSAPRTGTRFRNSCEYQVREMIHSYLVIASNALSGLKNLFRLCRLTLQSQSGELRYLIQNNRLHELIYSNFAVSAPDVNAMLSTTRLLRNAVT